MPDLYLLKKLFFIRLPRTSSIKMVDGWLIFTLFIPFAEVILHTRMEQLKQKLNQMDKDNAAWAKDKDKLAVQHKKIIKKLRYLCNLPKYLHCVPSPLTFLKSYQSHFLFPFRILNQIATYGLPSAALFFLCVFFIVGAILIYF